MCVCMHAYRYTFCLGRLSDVTSAHQRIKKHDEQIVSQPKEEDKMGQSNKWQQKRVNWNQHNRDMMREEGHLNKKLHSWMQQNQPNERCRLPLPPFPACSDLRRFAGKHIRGMRFLTPVFGPVAEKSEMVNIYPQAAL